MACRVLVFFVRHASLVRPLSNDGKLRLAKVSACLSAYLSACLRVCLPACLPTCLPACKLPMASLASQMAEPLHVHQLVR